MNHINDFITDYLDRTLSPDMVEKINAHLVFCSECKQLIKDIEHISRELKETPFMTPPRDLESKILAQLKISDQKTVSTLFKFHQWFSSWRWIGLTAVSVAVFILFVHNPRRKLITELPNEKSDVSLNDEFSGISRAKGNEETVSSSEIIKTQSKDLKMRGISEAPQEKAKLLMPKLSEDKDYGKTSSIGNLKGESKLSDRQQNEMGKKQMEFPSSVSVVAPISKKPIEGSSHGIATPHSLRQSGGGDLTLTSDRERWNNPLKFDEKLISSESEYQQFVGGSLQEKSPRINFSENDIVFIKAGPQPSAGYSIVIDKIEVTTEGSQQIQVIHYHLQAPPIDAITASVITYPQIVKIIPKFKGKTVFQNINR